MKRSFPDCDKEALDRFSDALAAAEREYVQKGVFFLQKGYAAQIQKKTNGFPLIFSQVAAEAEAIRRDGSAARYALFLYRALCDRTRYKQNSKLFRLPERYPLFGFVCLLPFIEASYDEWMRRGLPEDVVTASVQAYQACVLIQRDRIGLLGLGKRYFDFCRHYIDCDELRVGRLRFEKSVMTLPAALLRRKRTGEDEAVLCGGEYNSDGLCASAPPLRPAVFSGSFTETETEYLACPVTPEVRAGNALCRFPKSEYDLLFKEGDPVLKIHIPPDGPLTDDACVSACRRALDLFEKYYPEWGVKGFVCDSWMLAPELENYLKPSSHILAFARHFHRFPVPTEGKDVFVFVFPKPFNTYDDLPETTSLQRGLKALYRSGGYLYEYGGVFAADRIDNE